MTRRAEAVDTYRREHRGRFESLRQLLFPIAVVVLTYVQANAQDMSGSMRLDYQNTGGAANDGTVAQQYYVRLTDRLFVKNLVVFSSNVYYRTGSEGQPIDFRPRYDLQLSSTGYSGRVGYEPFTIRRPGASDEENRRWRSSVLLTPARLPRFGYDMTKARQDRGTGEVDHDNWSSYTMNWQGGSRLLAGSYSRQVREFRDSISETVDVYRAITSAEISLPGQGRINLGYNFDRTANDRVRTQSTELDQHVPSASAALSPTRWLSWTGQYSGRYITRRAEGQSNQQSNDQLATGTLSLVPTPRWSFGVTRYFERAEERDNQEGRSTDYWQVRASTDRIFFRRVTSQFSVYRIAYTGAAEGARYSDAYFVSLRGRPHRHAELSTEASFADRHGLQTIRYAVSTTSFLRLYPTRGSQAQIAYNAVGETDDLSDFNVSEESYTGNLQYTPDVRLSFSGGVTLRRNRLLDAGWATVWNAAASYRVPSFANLSAYYTNREVVATRPIDGSTQVVERPAQESLVLTVDWWLGPSTSLSANYSWRHGDAATANDTWGLGLTTQF